MLCFDARTFRRRLPLLNIAHRELYAHAGKASDARTNLVEQIAEEAMLRLVGLRQEGEDNARHL